MLGVTKPATVLAPRPLRARGPGRRGPARPDPAVLDARPALRRSPAGHDLPAEPEPRLEPRRPAAVGVGCWPRRPWPARVPGHHRARGNRGAGPAADVPLGARASASTIPRTCRATTRSEQRRARDPRHAGQHDDDHDEAHRGAVALDRFPYRFPHRFSTSFRPYRPGALPKVESPPGPAGGAAAAGRRQKFCRLVQPPGDPRSCRGCQVPAAARNGTGGEAMIAGDPGLADPLRLPSCQPAWRARGAAPRRRGGETA